MEFDIQEETRFTKHAAYSKSELRAVHMVVALTANKHAGLSYSTVANNYTLY